MNKPDLKDPKLAELTGILLGDGSIAKYECKTGKGKTKTHRGVSITLSSEEVAYRNYIKELIEELFEITPKLRIKKTENAVDIRSFKKSLFDFLTTELGLKEAPKWDRAVVPEIYLEKELEKRVLRGYFDTDGSVVLTNNNGTLYPRLEMKISPSPMQDQLANALERQNFCFGKYGIGKGKVRIQMNGKKQLSKWSQEIGFANRKHLDKLKRL